METIIVLAMGPASPHALRQKADKHKLHVVPVRSNDWSMVLTDLLSTRLHQGSRMERRQHCVWIRFGLTGLQVLSYPSAYGMMAGGMHIRDYKRGCSRRRIMSVYRLSSVMRECLTIVTNPAIVTEMQPIRFGWNQFVFGSEILRFERFCTLTTFITDLYNV